MAVFGTEPDRATRRQTLTGYAPPNQTVQAPDPPQATAAPATQPTYTPPANAGSWNSYYQQPGTTQPTGTYGAPPPQPTNYSGAGLEGFDTGKLNDPTHTSVKYTFGRLASKYPATAGGYSQLIQDPEFQRMGFQSLGNGNIRLPNGETIDVMRAFGEGGRAWQWGNTDAVAQGQAQALPTDYTGWLQQQYGYQPQQQQQQPAFDPYAYAAQLQAYYAQQQAQQQQPAAQTPPTQVWEQPSTPAPYDQGYGVQPVSPYDPYAGYNGGTETLGAPQQAVSALARGMYPPQMFGDYYGF
jgi:hypothetical protein